jgi:hypothetical protein
VLAIFGTEIFGTETKGMSLTLIAKIKSYDFSILEASEKMVSS